MWIAELTIEGDNDRPHVPSFAEWLGNRLTGAPDVPTSSRTIGRWTTLDATLTSVKQNVKQIGENGGKVLDIHISFQDN